MGRKNLGKPRFFGKNANISISVFDYSEGKNSKFSFSISKKVEKSAVLRNKMRRIGYKVIENELNSIKKGFLGNFDNYFII